MLWISLALNVILVSVLAIKWVESQFQCSDDLSASAIYFEVCQQLGREPKFTLPEQYPQQTQCY